MRLQCPHTCGANNTSSATGERFANYNNGASRFPRIEQYHSITLLKSLAFQQLLKFQLHIEIDIDIHIEIEAS